MEHTACFMWCCFLSPNLWFCRRALCSAGLPLWKLCQSLESKGNLLHVPDGTDTGKPKTLYFAKRILFLGCQEEIRHSMQCFNGHVIESIQCVLLIRFTYIRIEYNLISNHRHLYRFSHTLVYINKKLQFKHKRFVNILYFSIYTDKYANCFYECHFECK